MVKVIRNGLVSFSLMDNKTNEYLVFNDRFVFYDLKHLESCLEKSECEDSKINYKKYIKLVKEYLIDETDSSLSQWT